MQTSANGVAFIKSNEGLRLTVYNDDGKACIGYGHDLQSGESFLEGITAEQADAILTTDLRTRFEPPVNRLAPWANQNQFDALVDFCFNLGPARLATMLHHGQAQVPTQMLAWCYGEVDGVEAKSAPLESRRQKEVALFNTQV
jgi:GH24 family phage-related lysozyme (muramidase)